MVSLPPPDPIRDFLEATNRQIAEANDAVARLMVALHDPARDPLIDIHVISEARPEMEFHRDPDTNEITMSRPPITMACFWRHPDEEPWWGCQEIS